MRLSDNKKQLLKLLADHRFCSGTYLAGQLNMSRSAVWKLINSLILLGIDIKAVKGKGYRLVMPLELIDKPAIFQQLTTQSIQLITDFQVHDEIESTNSHLLTLAHQQGDASGVICLSEKQTAGKGRRGRTWVSPFGCNLYLSLLWKFDIAIAELSGLSLSVGVAVIKALEQQGIHDVGLKWPNDIYWQQKKLGGILVEVTGDQGGPCSAVIGLGLNVLLSQQEGQGIEQDWVDLATIMKGKKVSRNALLASIIEQLLALVSNYNAMVFKTYRDAWVGYDCMRGRAVDLFIGHEQVTGVVQGINEQGLLSLELPTGEIKYYASGEVSFSAL